MKRYSIYLIAILMLAVGLSTAPANFGSRTALANDGVTILKDSGAISQVKIGVNYRFSGPAAVVARY
jgi:hypothetical protein